MKGVFFQKPMELNLFVEGESFRQGDTLSGELVAKNAGAAPSDSPIQVRLAVGKLKDVRQKSSGAFTPISSAELTAGETSFRWSFKTDRNCPITDSAHSLFLVYGRGDALEQLGQLQLTMSPHEVIEEFLKILEVGFRFVQKSRKSNKGWVEVKLAAPDSRAFAMIENLVLQFRFEGENLRMRSVFTTKKIEASAASFETKKAKRESEQTFAPQDYRVPSGRIHFEKIEAAFRALIEPYQGKLL